MKTITTILIAIFTVVGPGASDAFALKHVSPEQLRDEYRRLQVKYTHNNTQISTLRSNLVNSNHMFVYSLKGSGQWVCWTKQQVAEHLKKLYGSGQKADAWLKHYAAQHTRFLARIRQQLAALEQMQVDIERRMRNIQAILKQPVNVTVAAPNLCNGTLDQAKATVANMSIGLRWVFKTVSSPSDHNRVLAQSITPGTGISIGTTIGVDVGYCPPSKPKKPKKPVPAATVWVMKGGYPKANPEKKRLKTTSGKRSTLYWNWSQTTVRLSTTQALIHRLDESDRKVTSDWKFKVGFSGKIPRTLKKGDTFTITLIGKAGGAKMANHGGQTFEVRSSGLDRRPHGGGKSAIFVGRSASTGKLYKSATKTITFTVQSDTRRPRLHFIVGNWGTMAAYEWVKPASQAR